MQFWRFEMSEIEGIGDSFETYGITTFSKEEESSWRGMRVTYHERGESYTCAQQSIAQGSFMLTAYEPSEFSCDSYSNVEPDRGDHARESTREPERYESSSYDRRENENWKHKGYWKADSRYSTKDGTSVEGSLGFNSSSPDGNTRVDGNVTGKVDDKGNLEATIGLSGTF